MGICGLWRKSWLSLRAFILLTGTFLLLGRVWIAAERFWRRWANGFGFCLGIMSRTWRLGNFVCDLDLWIFTGRCGGLGRLIGLGWGIRTLPLLRRLGSIRKRRLGRL